MQYRSTLTYRWVIVGLFVRVATLIFFNSLVFRSNVFNLKS